MNIGTKITGGFAIALAFLLVVGTAAFWTTSKLVQTNRQVTHTYENLIHLEEAFSSLKDAQRSVRGFVISGKKDWLKPYDAALASIPRKMEKVQQASGDKHQQKLKEIQNLIDDTLREFARYVGLRDTGDDKGFVAAVDAIKVGVGHKDSTSGKRKPKTARVSRSGPSASSPVSPWSSSDWLRFC